MSDMTGSAAGVAPTSEPISTPTSASIRPTDPTDRPIPLWPEGVLAVAAGITLLVIGLRHRTYLQRKAMEMQRAVEEFQRHGGMEEIRHVAQQATEMFKGAGS